MSGGAKAKKAKKANTRSVANRSCAKSQASQINGQTWGQQFLGALEADDAAAMFGLMRAKNPLLLQFRLQDNRVHSLMFLAAAMGSYNCMFEILSDERRFNAWSRELSPEMLATHEQECADWSGFVTSSVRQGDPNAIKVHHRILYRAFKALAPSDRQKVMEANPSDEHMAHVLTKVVADEDFEALSAGTPQGQSGPRKGRGLDD